MGVNAATAAGGGIKFDPIEAGTYPSRLVAVIDLGLQAQRPYAGQEKPPVQEVAFTYELTDEFLKDEDGEEMRDKPRHVTEMIPLYNLNADKAKSTKRYKALDPTGAKNGNFADLLGTPVDVTIVNNPGKGAHAGKIFSNIAAVATMRPRVAEATPEAQSPLLVFDLDAPDMDVFKILPQFIRDKIKANLNYEGSDFKRAVEALEAQDTTGSAADVKENNDDDELPY